MIRESRLSIRITPAQDALIRQAAGSSGASVSEFVVRAAEAAAARLMKPTDEQYAALAASITSAETAENRIIARRRAPYWTAES